MGGYGRKASYGRNDTVDPSSFGFHGHTGGGDGSSSGTVGSTPYASGGTTSGGGASGGSTANDGDGDEQQRRQSDGGKYPTAPSGPGDYNGGMKPGTSAAGGPSYPVKPVQQIDRPVSGSSMKSANPPEITATTDNRSREELTLQKGADPSPNATKRAMSHAIKGTPPGTVGNLSGVPLNSYRSDRARHDAQISEGIKPDSYAGTVSDGRTGTTANVEYDAVTNSPMGNTMQNLQQASVLRNSSIQQAQGALSPEDRDRMNHMAGRKR